VQTLCVEAVGATGQQHPVTGLQPYRQRIGEAGQQQVARIDLGTVAGVRDRHFVETVQQQEGRPGLQMGEEVLAGQSVCQRPVRPCCQRLLELPSMKGAAAAAVDALVEIAQRHQQRQPAAQVHRRCLGEFFGRRHGMREVGGSDSLQHRPTAEGRFAAAGGGWNVKRLRIEPLQQRDRLSFRCFFRLRPAAPLAGRRDVRLCRRRRQRRHIDMAERQRLPLLPLLAEETDVGTFAAQPVDVCVGYGRFDPPRFPVRGTVWQAPMQTLVEVLPQQRLEVVRRRILVNSAAQ
jgi:hypothetical protein